MSLMRNLRVILRGAKRNASLSTESRLYPKSWRRVWWPSMARPSRKARLRACYVTMRPDEGRTAIGRSKDWRSERLNAVVSSALGCTWFLVLCLQLTGA